MIKKVITTIFLSLSVLGLASCDSGEKVDFSFMLNEESDSASYETNLALSMFENVCDPQTFVEVNDFYYLDNQCVYYFEGAILEGANPQTFSADYLHGLDDKTVYYEGVVLEGADPATFESLDFSYSRDDSSVYIGEEKIEGADVATFQMLNAEYSKDATQAFYLSQAIEGADVETFEANAWKNPDGTFNISEISTATDKNYIYKSGVVVGQNSP